MLAAQLPDYGATPEMVQVDEPRPGDGQALVELLAAAVNPVDLNFARGGFHAGSPPPPYVVGSEGVGRVLSSSRFPVGARIYTSRGVTGSLAERFVVDENDAYELAEGADDDAMAAALGIAGLAGWLPITERARVRPGERVLVLGASGSVGTVAVQAARLAEAGRIVAVARSAEGLARAVEV